ncbi:MAG: purine-nucleoside phosphorylase [SAR324 cluster bacterium]|nr:purine-nucleoside phosphorylase [SAR324 cluster bacterium]
MDSRVNKQLDETVSFVEKQWSDRPEIAVVLGSGLGPLAEAIENQVRIPYAEVPNFAVSTVSGHAGELICGSLQGRRVICMNGRVHYYEGYTFAEITFPIKLFKRLGVKTLILTNAVGGIKTSFAAGDLMIVSDHLNLMGSNPLMGANNDTLGPRFPDMSEIYSRRLQELARKTGKELGLDLKTGVFAALTGPSYETPAEVRMLSILGADAVGMSVVPEAIIGNHMGLEILAISCVTNVAAGIRDQKLSHAEVQETAARIKDDFTRLVSRIIEQI